MPPTEGHAGKRIPRESRVAEYLFVPAIEKILDPNEYIEPWPQGIAPAQIGSLVSGISDNSKAHSIRILAFTDKSRVQSDETTPKDGRDIDGAGMPRPAGQFLPGSRRSTRR